MVARWLSGGVGVLNERYHYKTGGLQVMPRLFITLGRYNSDGIYAAIEDSESNDLTVYSHRSRRNVEKTCREAAKRLRLLADAYDALATMDEPLKIKTQNAAMAAARQAAKQPTRDHR
jgi:hypothetical protein